MLENIPDQGLIDNLKSIQYGNDEYIIWEKTIFVFCPNGYGRIKLTNTFFENKLKTSTTTRNWKTITKLVELSSS